MNSTSSLHIGMLVHTQRTDLHATSYLADRDHESINVRRVSAVVTSERDSVCTSVQHDSQQAGFGCIPVGRREEGDALGLATIYCHSCISLGAIAVLPHAPMFSKKSGVAFFFTYLVFDSNSRCGSHSTSYSGERHGAIRAAAEVSRRFGAGAARARYCFGPIR